MEKYSVLMSLYIKEKPEYLDLAIKSMIEQTLMPDEIVIVKDGTITRELEKILDNYVQKYPKLFNIVGYERNKGLGLALNFGLEYCKNDLVARMDTDDISEKDRCRKQVKYLMENPEIDILGGQIEEFMDKIDNVVGKRIVPLEDIKIKEYLKKRCPFNHMSVMFRKKSIKKAGNYKDWYFNEDYYLWIRALLKGLKFGNLKDILVKVRVGNDMYRRRGGVLYFKSEYNIQKYLLKNKVISIYRFLINIIQRFIIQIIFPSTLRGIILKKFARK